MKIRLAALGFYHESNTFIGGRTELNQFQQSEWLHGDAIRAVHAEARSSMAGYLAIDQRSNVEVVPLFFTRATPSGVLTRAAFERIADELVASLEREGPWDGVLLVLHGAAVSEDYLDADGEIAARVRATVGGIPVGVVLDMHANISQRMIDSVTATTIYRTNPHVDARDRALDAAGIVVATTRGEVSPVQALIQVPAVLNIVQMGTADEPMRSAIADVATVSRQDGMLSVGVAEGYPYADVPELGMAVVVVHDGDTVEANRGAGWIAERLWSRRQSFVGETATPEAALKIAPTRDRPIVLMDVGDNIGGGAPGDSTELLEVARRLGVTRLLAVLFDPAAVAACKAAGVGSKTKLQVGGRHGSALDVEGLVRSVHDGRFEEPMPTHGGFRHFDAGTTVVVDTTDDQTLVLTSKLIGQISLRQLTTIGIDPRAFDVVVVKGVQAPRAAYEPIASKVVMVGTSGPTAADFTHFAYSRRRPLYPFDEDLSWSPRKAS